MAVRKMSSEPEDGGLLGSVGERFTHQTTLALILVVLGVVAAILVWMSTRHGAVVENMARANAAAVARSVGAFQQMYHDEVDKRVASLRGNSSTAAVLAALPDAEEAVSAASRYGDAHVQVFRAPGTSAFQRNAAAWLTDNPGDEYAELRDLREGPHLSYAVDENRDGLIVEVEVPVRPIASIAYPELRFWLLVLGGVVAVGLLGLLLRSWSSATGMSRYMQAQEAAKRELEREVAERTKIEEDLRAQAQEVIQGVAVVSEAVSRILTSMTQVVSGATTTAASVTEAAATVEQVKQTSQMSNQRATDVATIAERAVQISQTGEHSVRQAIEGMTLVRDQMQSIAESVRKLGDQSRAIGEIITAVSELAEQSNLLAINAAIEAAKAGEHGKGFAVVAQEVKALAEQSKQATAQVRTMLEQIQRAANVAVMVTEQGTKSAESGVKQSLEAGESIRALANSISEAARAVGQISASSQQQLIGMDHVATAMQDIKEGSQENVASMREIESSVQNLSEVGASLEALVSRYVVSNNNGMAA